MPLSWERHAAAGGGQATARGGLVNPVAPPCVEQVAWKVRWLLRPSGTGSPTSSEGAIWSASTSASVRW